MKKPYSVGDIVTVDRPKYGREEPFGTATILSVLPIVNKITSYQVQFEGEKFTRHLNDSLISGVISESEEADHVVEPIRQSSWINMSKIHTKKS